MAHILSIKDVKPASLICPKQQEIREKTEYENWPDWCWPNNIFHGKDYPCSNCEFQADRYRYFLNETVERANKDKKSNIHLFRKICKKIGGTFVKFGGGDVGLLVGCTTTLEDYYWLYIDENLKVRFDTCVDSCKPLETIPASLSILDYLRKNQPHELLKKVQQILNESKYDMLITPITIYKK